MLGHWGFYVLLGYLEGGQQTGCFFQFLKLSHWFLVRLHDLFGDSIVIEIRLEGWIVGMEESLIEHCGVFVDSVKNEGGEDIGDDPEVSYFDVRPELDSDVS